MLNLRKGGRVVDCIGFENRRNFTVTEGSNPSLSVSFRKEKTTFQLKLKRLTRALPLSMRLD